MTDGRLARESTTVILQSPESDGRLARESTTILVKSADPDGRLARESVTVLIPLAPAPPAFDLLPGTIPLY